LGHLYDHDAAIIMMPQLFLTEPACLLKQYREYVRDYIIPYFDAVVISPGPGRPDRVEVRVTIPMMGGGFGGVGTGISKFLGQRQHQDE
jgi:hypothetical protein